MHSKKSYLAVNRGRKALRGRRRRPGPAPRRRLAYDATRERILQAATEVFRRGYRATSLDDVAARLGITKPAIYHYFPSKEHLLCELYDRIGSMSVNRMEEIFRSELPPDEKLAAMVRAHIELVIEQLPLFTILFHEEDNLPAPFRRRVVPKHRAYGEMMVEVYRQGVTAGRFKKLDPSIVVNALLAMGNWLYRWYRPDGRLSPTEISGIMLNLVTRGYLEPAGRRQTLRGETPRHGTLAPARNRRAAEAGPVASAPGKVHKAETRRRYAAMASPKGDSS
jgi:AcrR family transcriptional regulator